jgi:hypothetical protein
MSMNALIGVVFAFTAVLASPAFAQTTSRAHSAAHHSYAQHRAAPHASHRGWAVYNTRGRYRGTDPDPFIRDQLRRCREC